MQLLGVYTAGGIRDAPISLRLSFVVKDFPICYLRTRSSYG